MRAKNNGFSFIFILLYINALQQQDFLSYLFFKIILKMMAHFLTYNRQKRH